MEKKENKTIIMLSSNIENRMKGCFYGCAVGDALGCPLEFKDRDTVPLVTEMIPTENHGGLPAGSWTDDTSMMLCLAASMVARGRQDATSELTHYVEWFRKGYLGVNGTCVDIGTTTKRSLIHFIQSGNPIDKPADELEQGNGSLMRIAPVPIFYWSRPDMAFHFGVSSSYTTHNHPSCGAVCGIVSSVIAGVLSGKATTKGDIQALFRQWESYGGGDGRIQSILRGEYNSKTREHILSSGYVMDTLEAALWAFFRTDDFESGAILAVNLGHDADTVGAVYGTLAGAFYGFDAIPTRWLDALQGRRYLDGVWSDVIDAVEER